MTMNVVSGIPQAVNGHRHTISSMTEEWRGPGEPTEHEDEPEPDRVESTVIAFIKGAGQALQWGSP